MGRFMRRRKRARVEEPHPVEATEPAAPAVEGENKDPLADRLHRLQWPNISSDVRERCWEKISDAIEELGDEPPPPAPGDTAASRNGEPNTA